MGNRLACNEHKCKKNWGCFGASNLYLPKGMKKDFAWRKESGENFIRKNGRNRKTRKEGYSPGVRSGKWGYNSHNRHLEKAWKQTDEKGREYMTEWQVNHMGWCARWIT